jgi:hypothetical protein
MDLNDEKTIAYLAGLVDGDGHITIVNRNDAKNKGGKQGFRVQLCIYNCSILISHELKKSFGGHLRSNYINKTHPKWRNCFEYKLNDAKAIMLIEKILPYLIGKKEQAEIVLQFNKIMLECSAAEKRWNPEKQDDRIKILSALKDKINKLNIRGNEKIFKEIDFKSISFNINYLAGFCDADGSIMINKSGKSLVAKITFTNTNKNIIDWIKFHKGGNLESKYHNHIKWNTSYNLLFTSRKACVLAEELYSSLMLKRRQAKLIITFGKIKGMFGAQTLTDNPNLKRRHINIQTKIKSLCSNLNKRSI